LIPTGRDPFQIFYRKEGGGKKRKALPSKGCRSQTGKKGRKANLLDIGGEGEKKVFISLVEGNGRGTKNTVARERRRHFSSM